MSNGTIPSGRIKPFEAPAVFLPRVPDLRDLWKTIITTPTEKLRAQPNVERDDRARFMAVDLAATLHVTKVLRNGLRAQIGLTEADAPDGLPEPLFSARGASGSGVRDEQLPEVLRIIRGGADYVSIRKRFKAARMICEGGDPDLTAETFWETLNKYGRALPYNRTFHTYRKDPRSSKTELADLEVL